ncbi:hypothetical protein GCM10028784_14650 [Myceligenerans cantabricum]
MPYLLSAPERPVAFAVVFWAAIVVSVALLVTGSSWLSVPSVALSAASLVAAAVLWAELPWDGSVRGRVLAPVFVVVVTMLGLTGLEAVHLVLIVVGFAALARAWGMALAAGTAVGFVLATGALQLTTTPADPGYAMVETVAVAAGCAVALAAAGAGRARAL